MSSANKFDDISIEKYSENSIVVIGNSRKYKEDLKKLGGKYNANLKNGPGWIFMKKNEKDVLSFINNGVRLVSDTDALLGEERSKIRADNSKSSSFLSQATPTITEFALLISMIKDISTRMIKMETMLNVILTPGQKNILKDEMTPLIKKEIQDSDNDDDKDEDDEEDKEDEDEKSNKPPRRLLS